MIRIIIVDDEILSRIGIKSFFDGNSDIMVEGVFAQALEAIEFLSEKQIDIVITDIEMSDMNGLEFIKIIREKKLSEGIIILSCHDNFDYAREAISLGTDSYLLKHSINDKLLISEIQKVYDKISVHAPAKKALLHKNLEVMVKEEGIYRVGVLKFSRAVFGEETPLGMHVEETLLINLLEEIVGQYHMGTLFAPYKKDMFIIFRFDRNTKKSERESRILEYAGELKKNLEQYVNKFLVLGISEEFADPREIPSCYQNAETAAALSFYDETNFLYQYSRNSAHEVPYLHFSNENFLDEEGIDHFREELESFLRSCRKNSVRVGDLNEILIHKVNTLVYKVLNQYRFQEELINKWTSVYRFIPAVMNAENATVLKANLEEVMTRFQEELLFQLRGDEFSEVFQFIDSNLSLKLSLTELAALNCMSIPSFCKKFKERTGMTLVQYINQQKIERVKQLLVDHKYTLGQIAEIVGFSNENYMIRVFKKVTGQTVKDYRSDYEDINLNL